MEVNVATLRERLAGLKDAVIEGCKNTLAAMKERGISALGSVARFFHVRPGLESLRDTINDEIKVDEKTVSKVEAVSAECHEAGRHLKSIDRTLIGEEAVQEVKAAGKLAKTMQAPYRAERVCYLAARGNLDKAAFSLERLEKAAEKQPSILKAMRGHKETSPPKGEKSVPVAVRDERQISGQLGPRFSVSPWPVPP